MSEPRQPYRVLVGSYRLADEDGEVNEYSRGDLIRLTDAEVAANPNAFEPWRVDATPVAVPTPTEEGQRERIAELEAALADANAALAARDARIAELEAAKDSKADAKKK